MHASLFHGLSNPLLLFGVLFVAIIAFSAFRRNSESRRRAAALQSMGYARLTRQQAFDNPKLIARLIFDNAAASISDWVGKGQSAFGETVIFDFTHDMGVDSAGRPSRFTVVAFRVAHAAVDFEISHVLLLERLLHLPNEGDIVPPHMATYDRHSHQWTRPEIDLPLLKCVAPDGNPAFAQNYRVWSSDPVAMQRVLTRAMMDALVRANDVNLHVAKRGDWLMVYRWVSSATAPGRYPALVQEAAQLAAQLDLGVRGSG